MAEGEEATEAPKEFDADWKPSEGLQAGDPVVFDAPVAEADEATQMPYTGERAPTGSIDEQNVFPPTAPSPEEAAAMNADPDPAATRAAAAGPLHAQTAFLCYLDETGHWCGDPTLINREVIVDREANVNDYRHACADMQSDLLTAEAGARGAQSTLQLQQAAMQQVMKAQEAAKMSEALGFSGGPGVDLAELKRRAEQGGIQLGHK